MKPSRRMDMVALCFLNLSLKYLVLATFGNRTLDSRWTMSLIQYMTSYVHLYLRVKFSPLHEGGGLFSILWL